MTAHPTPAALRGSTFYWLLDFHWGGTTYYIATRGVEGPTAGDLSTTVYYTDGLEEVHLEESISFRAGEAAPRSAAFTVFLASLVDVPSRISAGHPLHRATATLRFWADDGTSAGIILAQIQGIVLSPEWGSHEEPVKLSLRESWSQDTAMIPPLTAKIDTTTLPNADTERLEAPYPWVIGIPGSDAFFGSAKKASPAYYSQTATDGILVAGHPVAASSVRVTNLTDGSGDTLAVTNGVDGRGQPIATVDYSGSALTVAEGDELYSSWVSGGGMVGPGGEMLRGAGDILCHFLRLSSLRVDWGRVEALRGPLNAYLIDGWIQTSADARISPSDWLRDHLLPLLPVAEVRGPEGLYFILWRPDAGANESVASLIAGVPGTRGEIPGGTNCHRVSTVKASSHLECYSEVVVSYGHNVARSQWLGRVVVSGHPETLAKDSTALPNPWAAQAELDGGYRAESLSTEVVWDATTAGMWAQWWIRYHALPWSTATYLCGPEMGYLEPGDIVSIADAEMGWDGKIALLCSRALSLTGDVVITLTWQA